jgi:hypothetical protein
VPRKNIIAMKKKTKKAMPQTNTISGTKNKNKKTLRCFLSPKYKIFSWTLSANPSTKTDLGKVQVN